MDSVNLRNSRKALRDILAASGASPDRCEVPGCYFDDEFGLDIHHIVPKSERRNVRFDVDCAENLVALCPNHHRVAGKLDWKSLNLKDPESWKKTVLGFIRKQAEASEQAN